MHKVYDYKEFIIFDGSDHYVLVNKSKKFQDGHTHLKNYKTALWLVKLSTHHLVPNDIPLYLLESLIRINSDEEYLYKLRCLQEAKLSKSKVYYYNRGDYKYGKKRKRTRSHHI